jgi:pyruvate-formate lyase-activating enzyme
VLRVTGGEPTMSKDLWKLLDYLIENPQPELELAINTNMCVPDSLIDKLINKINDLQGVIKRLDIYTSLESTGAQAEYARDGLDFNVWQQNVRKVLDATQSSVAIMTTINILSLPSFVDFVELVMQLRKDYNTDFAHNRIPLSVNYLRWPPHLQCTLLSKEDRQQYADAIYTACEKWLKYYSLEKYARLYLEEWDQIQRFCDYLRTTESAVEHRQDFVRYIQEYDFRRNKSFSNIFPQFKDFVNLYKP